MLDGTELWVNLIEGMVSGFGGDIPWLSENPITGTVAAMSSTFVDVTFDASVVPDFGTYYGTLRVLSDDPLAGTLNIPVTMTVNADPTFGKLEGTVQGLGYCDASPAVVEGADVYIEASTGMTATRVTDAAGMYSIWLDEGGSPYTVTVTVPQHEVGLASVTVTNTRSPTR